MKDIYSLLGWEYTVLLYLKNNPASHETFPMSMLCFTLNKKRLHPTQVQVPIRRSLAYLYYFWWIKFIYGMGSCPEYMNVLERFEYTNFSSFYKNKHKSTGRPRNFWALNVRVINIGVRLSEEPLPGDLQIITTTRYREYSYYGLRNRF